MPSHLPGAGKVPDSDGVPEVGRRAQRGGRCGGGGRGEAGGLPGGSVAVVRGVGGERDGGGDRRRRSGGRAGGEVCGEEGSEEECDGELEPDGVVLRGRVQASVDWFPWMQQR